MPPRKPDADAVRRVMGLVMERLDCETAGDLVRALGISADRPYVASTAGKWLSGQSGPGFDDLMLMLSRARLLSADADAAWRGIERPVPSLEGGAGATPGVGESRSRRRAG